MLARLQATEVARINARVPAQQIFETRCVQYGARADDALGGQAAQAEGFERQYVHGVGDDQQHGVRGAADALWHDGCEHRAVAIQ